MESPQAEAADALLLPRAKLPPLSLRQPPPSDVPPRVLVSEAARPDTEYGDIPGRPTHEAVLQVGTVAMCACSTSSWKPAIFC